MRLLVFHLLSTLDCASMLLVSHLGQDEFLVLPVGLELELSLGVDEHLLLADVTEESVAFLLTRLLEANEVIFEAVVGLLLGLLGLTVDLLSLVFIMTINGIGTLSVQESRIPGVVGIRNILSVEGAADNVVQLAVGVTVQAAFFSSSFSLSVV